MSAAVVTANPATQLPACDSCVQRPASLVLTYPDTRFRLCPQCVDPASLPVAEPLDIDDYLAQDCRTLAERMDPRGWS